jgi:hypothetical protein
VLFRDIVVDVTATQFGKRKKVLVARLKQLEKQRSYSYFPWCLESRHDSVRSANRSWGEHCGRTYRLERRVVLQTFRKERR